MSIKVLKPGLQSSIQDFGRKGYMHLGVAMSGAMDALSMQVANWMVGNALDKPVIEICLTGPSLYFTKAMSVAIAGAKFDVYVNRQNINDAPVDTNQTIQVNAGDILSFGKRLQGARAYLACAAELDCTSVLGSCATHFTAKFGGVEGRALQKGDELALSHCEVRKSRTLAKKMVQQYSGNYLLRCVPSVETSQFNDIQQARFFANRYTLRSDSNRMGLRFDGKAIEMENMQELVSSGLTQGSVQLPPSGLPIVSSVDGQTIGGYPRIANVISADLFALGQLVAGDKVSFCLVTVEQAHEIFSSQQAQLAKLQEWN
jgi:biotin-dependent carboxylase-like uncharacterized protein